MEKYETLKAVGDGSFGSVTKARNKLTNEIVAIKRMKASFATWDEAMKLREVKSLRKLNHHNVVKLKEVIRQKDNLFFVFEFMEKNLYEIISKNVSAPTEQEIRLMAFDSLQGIAACHKNGYFHRDLKPENLLINKDQIVKLADFGLAREIRARPPFTEYVSTRWYRAPELLLSSTSYNSPIDIFAMGCILAEMYLLRPLAPGNSEADQLMKLCLVLGTPPTDWTEGYQLAMTKRIDFPRCPVTPLESIIPSASADAIDLILKMLQWDPNKRPTASACLQHPFFNNETRAEYQRKLNVSVSNDKEDSKRTPNGAAGFMQLRNSQNKGLQNKQMSMGVLTSLTNQTSMNAIPSQDQVNTSFIPKLGGQYENKDSGAFPSTNSKGQIIKRDSIAFKIDQNSQQFRSGLNNAYGAPAAQQNSSMTPIANVGSPNKPWDSQNTNSTPGPQGEYTGGQTFGLRASQSTFNPSEILAKNQNNNRGLSHNTNSMMASGSSPGQKVLLAPKLQGNNNLKPPLVNNSSSILNLPVLGQENMLQPTYRGMKGIESSKQFFRGEDNKINGGSYDQQMNAQKSSSPYNTKNTSNDNKILSPNSTSEKSGNLPMQSSRNLSVLNIKKSSARFLNPLNHYNQGGESGPLIGKMPSSLIDKYPGTSKPENPLQMPPRGVREAKNHQLFDKYVNRQNRKISMDLTNPGAIASSSVTENGAASSGFALPSLGNPAASNLQGGLSSNQKQGGGGGMAAPAITNGRNMNGQQQQSKYSSRQNRKDPLQASLSDSDFDF